MIGVRRGYVWNHQRYLDIVNFVVCSSSDTLKRLRIHGNYGVMENRASGTIDVPVANFYTLGGTKLGEKVEIQPKEMLIGETPVSAELDAESLCSQTRSRGNRTSLATVGFADKNRRCTQALDRFDFVEMGGDGRVRVFLRNEGSVPYVMDEVSMPLQLLTTKYRQRLSTARSGSIALSYEDSDHASKDVTSARRINVGNLKGYYLTPSTTFWGMEKQQGKKIRWSERVKDAKALFKEGSFEEIVLHPESFPFFLAKSNEKICPRCLAYVFDFRLGSRQMDALSAGEVNDYELTDWFLELADDIRIAGRSGIINPNSDNITNFEVPAWMLKNVEAEKLRRMFDPDKRFALVVALPLEGGPENNVEYDGESRGQEDFRII